MPGCLSSSFLIPWMALDLLLAILKMRASIFVFLSWWNALLIVRMPISWFTFNLPIWLVISFHILYLFFFLGYLSFVLVLERTLLSILLWFSILDFASLSWISTSSCIFLWLYILLPFPFATRDQHFYQYIRPKILVCIFDLNSSL